MENIKLIFKGTPYRLAIFAIEFGTRELNNNPLMWQKNNHATLPYMTHPRAIHPDTNPIVIELVIDDPNPSFSGELYAQLLTLDDKGRTLVTGQIEPGGDEIDQMITERYRKLYEELNENGLIELGQMPAQSRARRKDEIIYQGRIELDRERLFDLVRDFVRDANRVWGEPDDWRDFRAAWNAQESSILILASRNRTLGEYPIVEVFSTTAGQNALQIEIVSDAKGNREIAIALRDYLLDATAPAPTPSAEAKQDAPKEQNAETQVQTKPNDIPPEPEGNDRDDWFHCYYERKRIGKGKITLRYVATKIALSEGKTREYAAAYASQHYEPKIKKKNTKRMGSKT